MYDRFLNHLKTCGGCVGPRSTGHCRFALACSVAEALHKKGLVVNSKDLSNYGTTNRANGYQPKGRYGANNTQADGIGTYETE